MQSIEEKCGYWPTMPTTQTTFGSSVEQIEFEETDPAYKELYGWPEPMTTQGPYIPTQYKEGLDYELNPTHENNQHPHHNPKQSTTTSNNDDDYEPYLYGN